MTPLLSRQVALNILATTPLRRRPRGWGKWAFLVVVALYFVGRKWL
jgi:hypothetical protein